MGYNFKDLATVNKMDAPTAATNMIVEENGEVKMIPANVVKSPSGKLFKLTVSDSGTISAVEV